jgi:hypothetical protein
MTSQSNTRFTITANAEPRTLFSVIERKDGTLILPLKREPLLRLPGLSAPLDRFATLGLLPQVKLQKYSIHPSTKSTRQINFIHHTMQLETGQKLHSRHVTKAIKADGTFAFLFCRRCSDLTQPWFLSRGGAADNVSLGVYDPEIFTLMYAVVAGSPDTAFSIEGSSPSPAINIMQRTFKKVRLVLLWNFLSLPSHPSSLTGHHSTTKPDDPRKEDELDAGWTAQQCVDYFARQCAFLDDELRRFIVMERANPVPGQPLLIPVRRYFKDGLTQTREVLDYTEQLQMRILTL